MMTSKKTNPTEAPTDAPVAAPAQEAVPMAEPEGGWPADEFTGHGGSYVRDPLTGVRSRAPVVAEPDAA